MSCTDNAKVSDSGYTNTCDNSQSRRSSGSSLSRNSNRSRSSGYCGGHPSTFGSSNEALPKPISKKQEKEQNKKSKTLMTLCNDTTSAPNSRDQQTETGPYTGISINVSDHTLKQSEEVGTLELMDVTYPVEHNNGSNFTIPKEGLGYQTNPLDNTSPNTNEEEFGAIVSLHDGIVLHLTASFETALGYSKDAWVGHSFIDYVHPKDKATFAKKLADSVILSLDECEKDLNGQNTRLFCSLQRHTDMKVNKNIDMDVNNETNECYTEKNAGSDEKHDLNGMYTVFQLNLGFKQYWEHDSREKRRIMFLTITAQPVFSTYKVPEETMVSSIFSTRHTATGHLSHVDDDAVQHFGYLPQDMLGKSLFNYYHPADLPFIKDIYETVVRLDGSSFRSKPYRFAVRNGGYVLLETEWSSFINPWEKKVEFIVGHHKVLRGPENPDVFQSPDTKQCEFFTNMSKEILKESQIIQNEICALLSKKITNSTCINGFNLTKKSNDLAAFMESLIHEVTGTSARTTITIKTPTKVVDDRSLSKHDSVMHGEISPHDEYCDSKSSSETPLSYNQLNYNEKIERFFNSKLLLTTACGCDEDNVNLTTSSNDDIVKISSNHTPSSHNIPNHDSGGSRSNENLSSGSNNQTSSTSRDDSIKGNSNLIPPDNFKLLTLTETLLNKHNQDMEKLMVQKHKERRTGIKNSKLNKETRIKSNNQGEAMIKQPPTQCQTRGCKRSSSHNREGEFSKMAKYDETLRNCDGMKNSTTIGNYIVNNNVLPDSSRPTINVWPQTTVTQSLHPSTRSAVQDSNFPHILPVYYIPISQVCGNTINTTMHGYNSNQFSTLPLVQSNSCVSYAATPLSSVIYPSLITAPVSAPIIYTSQMILEVSTVQNENIQKLEEVHPPETTVDRIRPGSQATSITVEPGSIMSESSKKLLSPGGHFSSCVSVDGGCSSLIGLPPPIDNSMRARQIDSSLEDSSDSSFYGSFLNTSSGSSCNSDQVVAPNMPERYVSRCRDAEMTECERFSMVNELKANFKLQTTRGASSIPQKWIQKGNKNVQLSQQNHMGQRREAPWLQDVKMTPEIMYQYQMSPKTLADVLKSDMNTLKNLQQPLLVNDQLDQLYLDLELEGFGTKLMLDDSIDQSSDENRISGDDNSSNVSPQHKRLGREIAYSRMAMVYEENAPLPLSI